MLLKFYNCILILTPQTFSLFAGNNLFNSLNTRPPVWMGGGGRRSNGKIQSLAIKPCIEITQLVAYKLALCCHLNTTLVSTKIQVEMFFHCANPLHNCGFGTCSYTVELEKSYLNTVDVSKCFDPSKFFCFAGNSLFSSIYTDAPSFNLQTYKNTFFTQGSGQ